MVLTGLFFKSSFIVGMGGAQLLSVAFGRAWARLSVTHLRASGFEMVWLVGERATQIQRDQRVVIRAELRNRSDSDMRGASFRPIASSHLKVRSLSTEVDLPAHSSTHIDVEVSSGRIGRWGLHGIALEVTDTPLGGEGLYEVPLLFANPHGIEVVPRALERWNRSIKGGRSRHASSTGAHGRRRGEGDDLRELRDHVPGDAFKRIAWKASARRGRLMVRETEQSEREVVWLVVDVSAEGWAGEDGSAPLDLVAEEAISEAAFHVSRGNSIGVVLFASRVRTWLEPDSSPKHVSKIASALASSSTLVDSDRTSLDETDIAKRVAEHLRPLDPRGLSGIPKEGLSELADRADEVRKKAPFSPRAPFAATSRDQRLRHYLAAFGIDVPPSLQGEAPVAGPMLFDVLDLIARDASKPSSVVIWAPVPKRDERSQRSVAHLKRRHIAIEWRTRDLVHTVDRALATVHGPFEESIRNAVIARAEVDATRSKERLQALGVRYAVRRGSRRPTHEVAK